MSKCARCEKQDGNMKVCITCKRTYCSKCAENEFRESRGQVCNHCVHKKTGGRNTKQCKDGICKI